MSFPESKITFYYGKGVPYYTTHRGAGVPHSVYWVPRPLGVFTSLTLYWLVWSKDPITMTETGVNVSF